MFPFCGIGVYNLSSTIIIRNTTNSTVTGQGMDKTFLVKNSASFWLVNAPPFPPFYCFRCKNQQKQS